MQVVEAWRRLSNRNKAAALAALIATALMLALLARAAGTPAMALLYSGLDPSAAGEILEALETMDVKADVRGDAIYVPEARRDATRMALARDGLPRQSQAGFEILDGLNGFATSSDLFDATYWRAKEGELARTILAETGVRSARVHLAIPKHSAFAREKLAPSAAVTVGMARGALDLERAHAMRLLVALAVPGLSPEQVAVLDAAGGVVLAPGTDDPAILANGKVSDREHALEQDLARLLEARVGSGNARVKVTMSVSDEQTVRHERLVDPDRRALATNESTEMSEQGSDASGVVTVASNLPDGDAALSAPAPAQSKRNETSEATRYEISEVKTETMIMPGALRQVHVAVLINDAVAVADDGAVSSLKRPEAELEALRKLVAAAVGFSETRGDVVTIESMPFDRPEPAGEEAARGAVAELLGANLVPILQLVIPAAVSLILALFVLRPLLAKSPEGQAGAPIAAPAAQPAALLVAQPATLAPAHAAETPIDNLQRLASEQKGATSAVLKTWLEQPEPAR